VEVHPSVVESKANFEDRHPSAAVCREDSRAVLGAVGDGSRRN
jgi:hypothetical protein